jgi:four helix bundle protein
MQDFKKLQTWQKAHLLAIAVYKISSTFPGYELYGLTSQIRRSCVSIPTNIAEGCGKDGNTEFGRFLQIAQGSASELEYQLLLANDLNYINQDDYKNISKQVSEVRRMLNSFSQKLKTKN